MSWSAEGGTRKGGGEPRPDNEPRLSMFTVEVVTRPSAPRLWIANVFGSEGVGERPPATVAVTPRPAGRASRGRMVRAEPPDARAVWSRAIGTRGAAGRACGLPGWACRAGGVFRATEGVGRAGVVGCRPPAPAWPRRATGRWAGPPPCLVPAPALVGAFAGRGFGLALARAGEDAAGVRAAGRGALARGAGRGALGFGVRAGALARGAGRGALARGALGLGVAAGALGFGAAAAGGLPLAAFSSFSSSPCARLCGAVRVVASTANAMPIRIRVMSDLSVGVSRNEGLRPLAPGPT